MIAVVRFVACAAGVLAVAACASTAPPIEHPTSLEPFCQGTNVPYPNAMGSVMTSTDDIMQPEKPTDQGVRKATQSGDGTIAHYADQKLAIPRTAAALGESDGYARVRELAVPPPPDTGATTRTIYLNVRDHGTYHWIAMTAYDVEDICVTGKVQS